CAAGSRPRQRGAGGTQGRCRNIGWRGERRRGAAGGTAGAAPYSAGTACASRYRRNHLVIFADEVLDEIAIEAGGAAGQIADFAILLIVVPAELLVVHVGIGGRFG